MQRESMRASLIGCIFGISAADDFAPNRGWNKTRRVVIPLAEMISEPNYEEEPKPKKRSPEFRRRLREEQAGEAYTEQEWSDLQVKYSNCCLRCGETDKRIVADHVNPLYRGGSNTIENIQPLCWDCNRWKGLKIIDYRPDSASC